MQSTPPDSELSPDFAWAPYRPSVQAPWDTIRAGHLLRRAGAGPSLGDLRRALADGPAKTIDRIFHGESGAGAFNRQIDDYEVQGPNARPIDELRGWWLRRMIESPHPLLERMTLFWHGWFAISAARIGQPRAALDHVRMLRANAFGSFDAMLAAATRDPATLLTAEGAENFKAKANEHLGRQLLARFTVGDGAFTEADARDTARAFTGLFVRGGQLREVPREHDDGTKTILGQTGAWSDRDFARIAAAHPATARRITRALYRHIIAEDADPSDAVIDPLASAFASNRNIGQLVASMLRSNLFFSRAAYRRRIKSPVEFAVGLCRAFEKTVPTIQLGHALAELGQDLYHPPTIKGWAGGTRWINRQTMAGRINLARALFLGPGEIETRLAPGPIMAKYGDASPVAPAQRLLELLLQDNIPQATQAAGPPDDPAAIAFGIASLPEYQMA
ncbi:MAG TPA: DUF1800 family protein [Verrucomicrobiae bacterium]|nr:DUF1800 family protein [Verrucomicrobiae bacterium]